MKKGLLLTLGVAAGLGLFAQAPKVNGVHKADLTRSQASKGAEPAQTNFYATASASQRLTNPSTATVGARFSGSYNAFGLLVSASHCLTADQALNAVMFTHRITPDWPADANVGSGYIEYSWTQNFGTSWDSSYFADQTSLGNKSFRYPSGGIINPAGNTTIANAVDVAMGPYTNNSTSAPWVGYYTNYQMMQNGATPNTTVYTNGQPAINPLDMPRVSFTTYDDSSAWVTGGLYDDAMLTTYRGASLIRGKWDGTNVNWTFDSIKPNFHLDGNGAIDGFEEALLSFSTDGQVGYCVFFGVDAAASTPSTRTFSPIVYKTTNGGTSWTLMPMNDFTTLPAITDKLIPSIDGSLKPWFDQSQGADVIVDANDQLHIVCTIGSGASDDDDSLGFTWTRTGLSGTAAIHYIYDVFTTANGWDAWFVDSLMTTTSTNNTIFVDGSNSGAAFPTDARLQVSHTADRTKLFYMWVDSDPSALAGENALPDLFGKAANLTTGLGTARKQFTTSQDFYFHYVSNVTLVNGTTYSTGVTNSIDRNGSHDVATAFDHYFYNGATFDASEFTVAMAVGIENPNADVASFNTYPNPANEMVNVNLTLVKGANVSITLVNALGQEVMAENRDLNSGSNLVQLNTSNLPTGVYFVNVSSPNGKVTSKIVVQ